MVDVNVKILGISATVIKGGNMDTVVKEALKGAEDIGEALGGGVETEFVNLADKEIASCKHCQWCIENRSPCNIEDDFQMIYDKVIECDGFILGAPAWTFNVAPKILDFYSRQRYYAFFTNVMRNKVGGAVTTGFFGFGLENTLNTLRDLIPIPVARGWAIASTAAFGQRPAYLEKGVIEDTQGMLRVRMVGHKVVEVARMIKYATENGAVLPDEYRMRTIMGARVLSDDEVSKAKELVKGVWRSKEK